MKRIYKYKLTSNPCRLALPFDAKILMVGRQGRDDVLWCEVTPEHHRGILHRVFHVLGTGDIVQPHFEFVGSFIASETSVWHVYEEPTTGR